MLIKEMKTEMKRIAIIQTAAGELYKTIAAKITDAIGESEYVASMDSQLIFDVVKANGMTDHLMKRTKALIEAACYSDADLVILGCSSVGAAAEEYAAEHPEFNVMRIDYPMAKYVVDHNAKKVAVLATLGTTVDPSVDLIRRLTKEAGKDVEVIAATIDGAFEAMIGGNMPKAIELIKAKAKEACSDADVVILAQASMVNFLDALREVLGDEKVILDSPTTCASYLKDYWN